MPDQDHYSVYYADKLWNLIPAMYRAEDSTSETQSGPLRELVNRIAAQAAILRRSIDRGWEDQSIETCDAWIIDYIGDLLATNLVASLDGRGKRLDVAKTIYYRRRKGTVGLLEELAGDITGWDARVVEFFRRLGRTRHGLDPAIGPTLGDAFPDTLQQAQGLVGPHTHTGMGGFADLRNVYGASRAHTAFDEYAHFADLRRGRGATGWHNIRNLGFFLWRLQSFGVVQGTPVPVSGCPDWYTFDPTGRDIELFASASRAQLRRFGDRWSPPEEWQLPTPISPELWNAYGPELYPNDPSAIRSVAIHTLPGAAGYALADRDDVRVVAPQGRFQALGAIVGKKVFASYHYGFSAPIGAGPYDRRVRGATTVSPLPVTEVSQSAALVPPPTGTLRIADSLTYATPADFGPVTVAAIAARNQERPVIRMKPGDEWVIEGGPDATLELEGLLISGGDIVLRGTFQSVRLRGVTLDPGTDDLPSAPFAKAADDGRELRPVRVWVEGVVGEFTVDRSILGPIATRHGGLIETFAVQDSILQSLRTSGFGDFTADEVKDATSLATEIGGGFTPLTSTIRNLLSAPQKAVLATYQPAAPPSAALVSALVAALNAAVNGAPLFSPARFDGIPLSPAVQALLNAPAPNPKLLNRLLLEEAFPHELADAAIAMTDGVTRLERVTVLGRLYVHELEASESILDDFGVAENTQRGCVRFSAWSAGSKLPKRYESVELPARSPVFVSRQFGRAAYGQLAGTAGSTILQGAQNGSEMGAFCTVGNAIKERSLRIKLEEYMPVGLVPLFVYVT